MQVDVAVEKQKLPKISGISRYSNFEFQNFDSSQTSDIVVWQAYKIGRGLKLPRKSWRNYQLLRPMKCYGMFTKGKEEAKISTDRYWKPIREPIIVRGRSSDDTSCSATQDEGDRDEDDDAVDSISKLMFPCPDAGCTKTYQSQCGLDKHLESGKHKYKPETVSLRDAAIGAYKQELEGLRLGPTLPSIDDAMEGIIQSQQVTTPRLQKGWALRTRRVCNTFTEAQRTYLVAKFDAGVRTGRKMDPKILAKQMRREFPKEEWLTWGQIASYWSRLARTQRGETIADLDIEDADDQGETIPQAQACEPDIEDDPHFNTLPDDIYDAIEENAKDIFNVKNPDSFERGIPDMNASNL